MIIKYICLLAIFASSAHGRGYQNALIELTPENFDSITTSQNIFVNFIYDFGNHEKFIELLEEIKNVAIESDDLETKMLKFGIFDCKKNVHKCRQIKLSRNVEHVFYGARNKWPELTEFLDQIIDEVNQEDVLIESLDKPGHRFLVLFKVVYCPYCKDTLEEWAGVVDYFKNSNDIQLFTLDCTRQRAICHRFDVTRYPKIKFIYNTERSNQEVFMFSGDRTKDEIIHFAKELLHATLK